MKKIFVVGSINTDLVISSSKMPNKGETITGNGFFTAHGGKGANQAVSASRSGAHVYMCGCVGDDSFGFESLKSLKDENINCSDIRVINNCSSGIAVIVLAEGDNRIVLNPGANKELNQSDIDNFLLKASKDDIYLTQLENPIDVIGYGLKKAKEMGLITILNPAPMNLEIKPYLKYVDIVTPNETECEMFGGVEELEKYVNTIIVTKGSSGFDIVQNKSTKHFDCLKVNVVDTTSAGDTFVGALAAKLASGLSLEESAKYGSYAASIACTKYGAQPSIPTEKEVNEFLNEIH